MAQELQPERERAYGNALVLFFAFFELACGLFLFLYVVPRVGGILLFLTLNGVFFFGSAAIFFFAYCAPARPIAHYRRRDGAYLILRSRIIGVLHGVLLLYAALILPLAALLMVIVIPWMFLMNPGEALPLLDQFSLVNLYDTVDHVLGLFVLIPLLVAFPWLFPKFLWGMRRVLAVTFADVGIRLDGEGLSVLGAEAKSIPWSWIDDVGVAAHGYTEVLVLKGGRPELSELRVKLDRRLPQDIRQDMEWAGEGVPMKLEFLRVRAGEVAQAIKAEFLRGA